MVIKSNALGGAGLRIGPGIKVGSLDISGSVFIGETAVSIESDVDDLLAKGTIAIDSSTTPEQIRALIESIRPEATLEERQHLDNLAEDLKASEPERKRKALLWAADYAKAAGKVVLSEGLSALLRDYLGG